MRIIRRFAARLRNFISGRRAGDRLREEMEEHLAFLTEENLRAGIPPDEARRQARLQFGGMGTIRESWHDEESLPWVEHLFQDARFALRQLRKSPGFTAIAVLTLALGIGATTAIFTLIYSAMIRPLPYPQADRIIRIYDSRIKGESTGGLVAVPRFFDVEAKSRSLESEGFYYFDRQPCARARASRSR